MKITKFDLKWVHMARYELILKLDGALCLVPGSRYQDLGSRILVPRSWYQDPGTKIVVPRSWYQDLGTKIFGGTSLVRWRDPPRGGGVPQRLSS